MVRSISLITSLLFLVGCSQYEHRIISKEYNIYANDSGRWCVCSYTYVNGTIEETFQDSCHLYKVGDTIRL